MVTHAGFYRFEHKFYSRKGNEFHGPSSNRHLSAKSNYNTNTNKVLYEEDSIRINLPQDRGELYAELMSYSCRQKRANARLAEDFTVSFDKRMSHAHQREALHNFLFLVTGQGKGQATGDIHRDNPDNPHAQCLVLDEDADGNAVMHFSRSATFRRDHSEIKGNLTKWLRKAWEFECNSVLAVHGYDFRVDCRTNLERGLDEAQKPRGYDNAVTPIPEMMPAETPVVETAEESHLLGEVQTATPAPGNHVPDARNMVDPQLSDDSGQLPPDAPLNEVDEEGEELIPAEDETDAEDAREGDDDMPLNRKLDGARRELAELRTMRNKRADVARLRTEYAYWSGEAVSARQKAEMASNAMADAQARSITAGQAVKETHFMGFRRGLNINFGIFKLKTAGFEKAVQAEAEFAKATYSEALRGADFREADSYANRATQKVWELEQRVASLDQHITMHERINGEEQDFDQAEVYFDETLGELLEGVSANDIVDAYERVELTLGEAKDLLQRIGHNDIAEWLQHEQEGQEIRH